MLKHEMLVNALQDLKRHEDNPIESPAPQNNTYRDYGVYNGDVIRYGNHYHGVFRCESQPTEDGKTHSIVGHFVSSDGANFDFVRIIIHDACLSIDDPRIFRHNGYFYIAATQVNPKTNKQTLHLTKTRDFAEFEFVGSLPLTGSEPYSNYKGIRAFVPVVDERKELVKVNGCYVGYCYHNQRDGTGVMFGFSIGNIDDLESYVLASKEPVMSPVPGTFCGNLVEPGSTPILTDHSIVMVFAGENKRQGAYSAGIVEFDPKNPTRIIRVHMEAILTPQRSYETELNPSQAGRDGGIIFPSGMCLNEETLHIYYGGADRNLCLATSRLG